MQLFKYIPLFIVLAFGLLSCSNDSTVQDEDRPMNGKFLEIRITTPRESRSNPTGGEDGDGREEGFRHENAINNLMVFIYNSVQGINGDSATIIKDKYYVDNAPAALKQDPMNANTYTLELDMNAVHINASDNVIVVANAGDLSELTTLGEVRDKLVTNAWTPAANDNVADCTNFVMSNENDGIVEKSPRGFAANVIIERVAARIDFWYINDKNYNASKQELIYDVPYNAKGTTAADQTTIAKVHVTNIAPINFMHEPTYMIKRVTEGTTLSQLTYCGEETTKEGTDIPNNYVIEPHTLRKTNTPSETMLAQWYGDTRTTTAATFLEDAKSKVGYWHDHGDAQTFTASGFEQDTYMTLAYTNENTQTMDQMNNNYITGLLLKATYEPLTVYKAFTSIPMGGGQYTDNLTTDPDYVVGQTFYRYTPRTSSNLVEGKCLYFSNKLAAQAYKEAHAEEMGEVYEYPNAECHYHIWLRHANDFESVPHNLCPMEFGIVRNNIYRIGIHSIAGPGSADPAIDDPYPIIFRIFVRPWNYRPQDVIKF